MKAQHRAVLSPRQDGFTLLEILVVVAVIALLVAILLPSLGKARQQARRVFCQSQLKQLATAWHQYLNAHNGAFLQDVKKVIKDSDINYGGKHGESAFFRGNYREEKPLNRYAGYPLRLPTGGELFKCPDDGGGLADFPWYGTSYRMNRMLVGQGKLQILKRDPCYDPLTETNGRLPNLNRSRAANESRLLLMGDFEWDTTYQSAWDLIGPDWHGRTRFYNMAFLDGHATFVHIRKGMHTTADYTVVPFRDLQDDFSACQQGIPGP